MLIRTTRKPGEKGAHRLGERRQKWKSLRPPYPRETCTIAIVLLLAFSASACGGGGGGSQSNSSTTNSTDVTGEWGGTYSSNIVGTQAVVLKLQGSQTVTGSFATGTGLSGTVSGSISGNTLNMTLTSTSNCAGTYSASGTVNSDLIVFTFSGNDCGGSHTGQGSITEFMTTGSTGWSGNWWVDSATDYVPFVSLSTSDSVNYSGKVKLIKRSDLSSLTADFTGQYGWGNHPSTCGNCYSWMLMPLSNIQGQLYAGGGSVQSGSFAFADYSGSLIRLSDWRFEYSGGGTYLSGDWFKRI